MTSIKTVILGIALTASFGLTACGDSTIKEMEALKDKVCQCKDRECIAKLKAESKGLEEKLKTLGAEEQEKALKIAGELMACAMTLEAGPAK